MRFTVLGPVRAWRGGTELELGPPKQRALLALLLTQAGHPVAVHEILDVLWGQNPPDSAVNVVHRHVGALRRLLEPELPARGTSRCLVRGSGGYRLEVEPQSLDLLRFRAMRAEAERLARDGEPGKATELLIEALGLWRGPTASGIASQARSHPVFTAVDREHLFALKEASECALAAGPGVPERVLITLKQAAAHHPLDEVLQARLMLVLAATGHQAEALEVHRTVRTRLADDLGLDPGPELRAAQQQVLRQTVAPAPAAPAQAAREPGAHAPPAPEQPGAPDAVGPHAADTGTCADTGTGTADQLTGPAADNATQAPAHGDERPDTRVRPAQLPPDLAVFSGRRAELERSRSLLPEDAGQPNAVVISAIGGMAGVGKTTLAVHWAHEIADRFPDGQLYVNLRGFHPAGAAMTPGEALLSFLEAFGVPAQRVPSGLDAQTALYRSLLADRRVLVVLDNARDSEHIRPLLPGAPGCLAIVTSRNQLHGLIAGDGARSLALNLPTEADARELLSRRLGPDRVTLEPRAVDEIIALCGRLPLALAIVSARAAVNPGFSLASIAAELREYHGSLDAFAGGEPLADARCVFSWSYRTLSPAAARLFRLVSQHPGPDISVQAAASLAAHTVREVRPLLAELVRAHLMSEAVPGRFCAHELVRAYASELGRELESPDHLAAASRRVYDHYLHSAHAADRLLSPHRERVALERPLPGAGPAVFTDQHAAAQWLDAERPVLLAAVEQAARRGRAAYCWRLASTLERYLDRNGRWQEQNSAQTAAAVTAQRLGDVRGQAYAHRALGLVACRLGRADESREHLLRSLELFGETDDTAGQGRTHRHLAFLANTLGRHVDALDHYRLACALYRTTGLRSGEASTLNEVGWTYILLAEYEEALDACRRSLASHQLLGDRNGEAAAWDSLGYAHHHLGEYQQALACFGYALDVYREIRDSYLEADTLVHIGDTHEASGQAQRAALAWRQALEILEAIGHPEAGQIRDKVRNFEVNATPSRLRI
ncbi:AfsR/SARP family transcriptional regulator [Streptomyces sp. NBC_01497]|uniref:AfsR/SARP family transcriptional regulator n=1 Tax=Streptomyces sp. NBC_01497 TaxID=2903885 RepID=UPI002E371E92|nr:BTAD domain-containing putative transcriptional regulator [Streptomyces sp. NBC_01497]